MTKKATWSGYRGDGKPVIPCVPECLTEKVEARGRMIQAPTDYKKRVSRASSSPRKKLKVLRNDLFLRVNQRWSIWDFEYDAQHTQMERKRAAVQKAYNAGDLDLMLAYRNHWERESLEIIRETVLALRGMGYKEACDILTEAHIQTVENVAEAIRRHLVIASYTIYKSVFHNLTFIPQGTHEVAVVAMSGEVEEDAVLNIIRQRGITDPEEIGKLAKEMLVDSSALASGVL